MADECQTINGGDWQTRQMQFFPNAELVVIPNAGHEMFYEAPQVSLEVMREYLNETVTE